MVGRIIDGKYRIEERLGQGGMGAVFRATHHYGTTLLGQVVIKFLHPEFVADPERRERFVREARAARELRSPYVVKVFDFGETEDGSPYLVMEYVAGRSLFTILGDGPLSFPRALRIARQVAEAMVECHDKGILHRDLKPDNILISAAREGDFVKIVDFGIAKLPTGPGAGLGAGMVSSIHIGTPRYMAPEQIEGRAIDGRIDIFALGVILFETLCGEPPIPLKTGDGEMAYVAMNLSEPPQPVSAVRKDAPPALDALLMRMMAKRKDDRPSSMAEVLAALEELSARPEFSEARPRLSGAQHILPLPTPKPVVRRSPLVPGLIGVVLGLLALLGWLLSRGQ